MGRGTHLFDPQVGPVSLTARRIDVQSPEIGRSNSSATNGGFGTRLWPLPHCSHKLM